MKVKYMGLTKVMHEAKGFNGFVESGDEINVDDESKEYYENHNDWELVSVEKPKKSESKASKKKDEEDK